MHSGETIRILRTMKGMKQTTIAKKLGISQPAYCKLERCIYIREEKLLQLLSLLNSDKQELDQVARIIHARGQYVD